MIRILIIALVIIPFNFYAKVEISADEKKEDIQKLIELIDVKKIADEVSAVVVNQITMSLKNSDKQIPDSYYIIIREEIPIFLTEQISLFMERVIPIFDKYYTHEEIKGLIEFYETPLGRKLIEKQPAITVETIQAALEWSQSLEALLAERLQKRLIEEDIKTQ